MSSLTIGITGGIGSGKTTVCKLFEQMGIPIYYADDRAKLLMNNQPELKAQIQQSFGKEVYDASGKLDRARLANIVFNDQSQLSKLNALVHPAVGLDSLQWTQEQQAQLPVPPYTLREAALLYESGSYKSCDAVIVVSAPEALRIERVMARDGASEAAVKARIDKQWPEQEKVERADQVILNDGSRSLIAQVWQIHRDFCRQSALKT